MPGDLGSIAIAFNRKLGGRPSRCRLHVAPPSTLFQTPSLGPPSVAAYTIFVFDGSNAIALIGAWWFGTSEPPKSTRFQEAPPSPLFQTPSLNVPA